MESVLSVIIPAYNEERWLPRLLTSIADARTVSAAGGASVEVIVADNGSTDRTGEVAREHGATVVDVPTRGIAAARNAGARVATSPIVAFVDADSHLHPESFVAVLSAMEDRACIGGSTGVTVEVWSIPLRILQAMTLPFRLIGIDSGLVFCRREDFDDSAAWRPSLPRASSTHTATGVSSAPWQNRPHSRRSQPRAS